MTASCAFETDGKKDITNAALCIAEFYAPKFDNCCHKRNNCKCKDGHAWQWQTWRPPYSALPRGHKGYKNTTYRYTKNEKVRAFQSTNFPCIVPKNIAVHSEIFTIFSLNLNPKILQCTPKLKHFSYVFVPKNITVHSKIFTFFVINLFPKISQ